MKKMKLGNNAVSLAGEYAVLSQLALHGYDAAMAVGKAKGVDILVSDPSSQRIRLSDKFRIGRKAEKHTIRTPTVENYEDNWDFRAP